MRPPPIVLSLAAAGALAAIASGHPVTAAPGCPILPASNPFNQRVDKLAVAADSATIVNSIGADRSLHADFGSGLYQGRPVGIPFTTVGRGQKKVSVSFDDAAESDRGPYPIPAGAPIEGGGDRHVLVVDRDACELYELFAARRAGRGWHAGSGATFDLRSNKVRPKGFTSADAAGLPILPGLARADELAKGSIDHALRMTVQRSRRAYIYPARHFASNDTDPSLPPMGLRLRLKASFPTAGFGPQARIVLTALKRYGLIVADNGSSWFISGAPSPLWNNDDLHGLGRVTGSNFEVVRPAR